MNQASDGKEQIHRRRTRITDDPRYRKRMPLPSPFLITFFFSARRRSRGHFSRQSPPCSPRLKSVLEQEMGSGRFLSFRMTNTCSLHLNSPAGTFLSPLTLSPSFPIISPFVCLLTRTFPSFSRVHFHPPPSTRITSFYPILVHESNQGRNSIFQEEQKFDSHTHRVAEA